LPPLVQKTRNKNINYEAKEGRQGELARIIFVGQGIAVAATGGVQLKLLLLLLLQVHMLLPCCVVLCCVAFVAGGL